MIQVPPRVVVLDRTAPPASPAKAGPIGPGAGVLQTELPLSMLLMGGANASPAIRMKKALLIARESGWIDKAESVIGGTISGAPWRIEDPNEEEVTDARGGEWARAYNVLARPYGNAPLGRKYSRSELWKMTLRHAGLCGNSFWFEDQVDLRFGTPDGILYIAPWRMTPNEDAAGNLLSWQLDKTQTNPGIEIPLDRVIHFMLQPPDEGHFGRGLVEIALIKAQNTVGFDKHIRQVLDAGGRLSGFVSPKGPDAITSDQMVQLERDARTITEMPDAAKRLQIVRGPIDFTQTTMTVQDLQAVDLMKLGRDDLLSLWGVPLSQIGGSNPAGLNSGEVRKYDKQALWENANHDRVVMFVEAVQYQMLDGWRNLGVNVEFEIEEPTFEDETNKYDLLLKSAGTPLRNRERRALINLDPFGPKAINPATNALLDDEIWLPPTTVMAYVAPEDGAVILPPHAEEVEAEGTETVNEGDQGEDPATTGEAAAGAPGKGKPPAASGNAASKSAGETPQSGGPAATGKNPTGKASVSARGRALHSALTDLRKSIDERFTPKVKTSVASVLQDQRREIGSRAKGMAEHLLANPKDTRVWWDGPKWDRKMREALAPTLHRMAEEVDVHVRANVGRGPAKAGPVAAVEHALTKSGTRITNINERTREAVLATVRRTVADAIDRGLSVADAGDVLEAAIESDAALVNGVGLWDEYRAELIARTEMMASYNDATLGSYTDLAVEQVQAIDGDDDPECAERNGQVFAIDEADAIEDHPNGTLDWIPVIPGEED